MVIGNTDPLLFIISNQNIGLSYAHFTLKYVVSCLCIIDIDLRFMNPVDYIHTD